MQLCGSSSKNKSRKFSFSRSAMRRRTKRLQNRDHVAKSIIDQLQRRVLQLEKLVKEAVCGIQSAKAELAFRAAIELPSCEPLIQRERPMPGFQFNLTTIAAAIELGKRVGFRAAADAMQIFSEMTGINIDVPSHDAIEQWTLRLGVASLKDTFKKGERVLWMADHSSQIGKERLLLIVGVALDDLPPPGKTLTFDKLKVLALVPGQSWKKEDVERQYIKLAEQIGAPGYLLCDGAVELREPAEKLEKNGQKTIVLGDLKHHAANVLEKEISRDGRYHSFLTNVGLTRCRVQQTELDQFTPPTLRSKSRFMNLGSLFTWATMVLYHLNTPGSDGRKEISADRMEQKLGWLREYASDLVRWNQCQEVIDRSLSVINLIGLETHTEELVERSLSEHNPNWRDEDCSATRIGEELLDWIKQSQSKLKSGERAWLSTEIIESLFGKFKQLERQHSKGGFTRLIAAIPTLCLRATRETVRKAFERIDSRTSQQWITDSLGKTLTARRNAAYKESKSQTCNHLFSAA
jgi:hypothetical protein